MATESLVVELDAKTQKLDAKLKATDAKLKDLEGQTKRNDLALANMAKGGLKVVGALASAAAAISTMVLMSARSTKELTLLSSQAKLTTGEFKSLAFATKQYGIDAENIADISKDMSDKIGEFAKVGTGAFQDFADVANLSKDDAIAVASEFQHMSSDQVLGRMVSMMEEAGATQSQMVFAMESMGNEASRLIPLFKDQSAELKTLRSAYDDINASMQINEEQQRELTELATNWDMLTSALGNSATAISATLAPVLNDFINDVIKIVPQATKVLNDFIFTFTPKGAEVEVLENQISGLNEQINELRASGESFDPNSDLPVTIWTGSEEEKQKLESLIATVNELIEKRNQLLNPPKVETPEGGEIGGETGGGATGNFALTDEQFNDQVSLFTEQSESFNSLALQIQTDGAQAEIDLNKWKLDEIYKQGVTSRKRKEAFDKQMQKFEELRTLGNARKIIGGLGAINEQFFNDNKALNAGLIVADTAATVMSEYKTGGWPAAIAAGLQGAAQLAALNSSSASGGGSVSPASGGGAGAAPIDVTPAPEIDVNVGDVSTGAASTMKLVLEDGTEIAEGLLESQGDAESNGRGDLF